MLSAFFSSSETGMMSLNRYRLKHLVKKHNRGAMRAAELLQRPDRLIGVILIGNNLVNILATSIATVIAIRLYGDAGIAIATLVLTLVILIFAEVTPKTIAALYPEKIAFPATLILKPLLVVLSPAVWMVSAISNGLARLLGVNPDSNHSNDHLHPDELRTVVDQAGDLIPDQHQGMMINVLDLEKATVEDIMIPRNEVFGINLDLPIDQLLSQLRNTEYTRLPVYQGDIDKVIGVLHMRNAVRFLNGDDEAVTHAAFKRFAGEPYFIPEATPLHTQLVNFKHTKQRMALVVDEYGDIKGLVTLEDLLEEIVGDFTSNSADELDEDIQALSNGWFMIDGSTSIRDINRGLNWHLPTDGPKTLNGLAMEYLENIPDACISFKIGSYHFEIERLSGKMIEKAKVRALHGKH